jgi:hypothetical protein
VKGERTSARYADGALDVFARMIRVSGGMTKVLPKGMKRSDADH